MSVTSAVCLRTTVAQVYAPAQSPVVLAQTRAVLSAEAERTTSRVGCITTVVTFLVWPTIFAAIFSFLASKMITWVSTPPVTMRVSSVLCTSMQRMPGAVDWCVGCEPKQDSLLTSETGAKSGKSRFLRVFDNALLHSVMRCKMSGVKPISALSSPAAETPAGRGREFASCSWSCWTCALEASRSRSNRATTRHAASCWYKAWDNCLRVVSRFVFSSYVSVIRASHSLSKRLSMPGMEVAAAGRGRTALFAFMSTKSSCVRSSFVTGHFPELSMFFRMRRFS
mmetsp:Transcript_81990/g.230771  ORF Transcript_81990/g.230771 Transcript_81990/m.230771 type:complete len:282 (-) Transcript_81990:158-1003(-)